VLDDNKILTLANAERIPMSVMCRISFEVSDLNNASPATVSRCGIVYVSPTDLYWKPLVLTWCKDRAADREQCSPDEPKLIQDLTAKYIEGPDMFKMLKLDYFYNNYECPEVVCTTMLLNLVTSLLLRYVREGKTIDKATLEKIWVFCLAWSVAGLCEQEDREKFHKWLESRGAPLPSIPKQQISSEKETIFDYWLDQGDGTSVEWQSWKATDWTAPKKMVFSQLLVPTSDSTRTEYVVRKISELPPVRSDQRGEPGPQNSLLIGSPGTAKTSCIIMYSMKFDLATDVFKRINFSSATLPGNFQENIESEIVKKSPKKYHPAGGKTMHVFVDDISMPMMNKYLDQPTLEIVRFLIENRALWPVKEDRGILRDVVNLKFLAAMTHPGGGRNSIPNRLKRHFFSVNLTPPSQKAIVDIYGKILNAAFNPKKYSPDVVAMKEFLIEASIEIWTQVRKRLLVTPTKFHYTFTIRELSRVFQGIC
jgi:dynein heavy chain